MRGPWVRILPLPKTKRPQQKLGPFCFWERAMHLRASRVGFEFFSVDPEKNRRPGCTPQGRWEHGPPRSSVRASQAWRSARLRERGVRGEREEFLSPLSKNIVGDVFRSLGLPMMHHRKGGRKTAEIAALEGERVVRARGDPTSSDNATNLLIFVGPRLRALASASDDGEAPCI